MNNNKKYFEFKGTISGTNYFLRNLLSSVVAFIAGYSLGMGIGMDEPLLKFFGVVLFLPALYFNLCTIYKRILAVIGNNAGLLTGLVAAGNLFPMLVGEEEPVSILIKLVLLVFGLFLIFKNSNIENHEG